MALERARQGMVHLSRAAAPALSAAQAALLGLPQPQPRPQVPPVADLGSEGRWTSPRPVAHAGSDESKLQWVILGCPGVGKGTYASLLSKTLEIPHISMGDLVREEVKRRTSVSSQLEATMRKGQLVPDELIFELLTRRLAHGMEIGEAGFLLDGFPRTTTQARILEGCTSIDRVLNLRLREDVLIRKCLGRRTCSQCGKGFNLADIREPACDGLPGIVMPPLSPPSQCLHKMVKREDDSEEVVKHRLEVYKKESLPVEDHYRKKHLLLDFEIGGGIPETWPRLLSALNLDEPTAELKVA